MIAARCMLYNCNFGFFKTEFLGLKCLQKRKINMDQAPSTREKNCALEVFSKTHDFKKTRVFCEKTIEENTHY